jgi:hypothetical protein
MASWRRMFEVLWIPKVGECYEMMAQAEYGKGRVDHEERLYGIASQVFDEKRHCAADVGMSFSSQGCQ